MEINQPRLIQFCLTLCLSMVSIFGMAQADFEYACAGGPGGCNVIVESHMVNIPRAADGTPVTPFNYTIPGSPTTDQFKVVARYRTRGGSGAEANGVDFNGIPGTVRYISYGTDMMYAPSYEVCLTSGTVSMLTLDIDSDPVDFDNLPGLEVLVFKCTTGPTAGAVSGAYADDFNWVNATGDAMNPRCMTRILDLPEGTCLEDRDLDLTTGIFNIHQDEPACDPTGGREIVFEYITSDGANYIFLEAPDPDNSQITHTIPVLAATTSVEIKICTWNNGAAPAEWMTNCDTGASHGWGYSTVTDGCGCDATVVDPTDPEPACADPSCDPLPTATVCADGTDSVTLSCDSGMTDIVWYDGEGNEVGTECELTLDNMDIQNGEVDDEMCFYYEATDSNDCPALTCCPVIVTVVQCAVVDLALIKVIDAAATPGPYFPGDNVDFTISVFNQGNIDATGIVVSDYMPAGFVFNQADNPTFTSSGGQITAPIALITAGASENLTITLQIDPAYQGENLVNNAEITSHDNEGGLPDEDSTPGDNAMDASELATDNDYDDESPGSPGTEDNMADDDDFDPAFVEVSQIFDLALEKTISSATPGPYTPGDIVTFTIEICNQGTLDAYNVEVDDYYVVGELILADTDWTGTAAGVASLNNDIVFIASGECQSVNIDMQIDPDYVGSQIINYGEITQADDDDVPGDYPIDEDSVPGDNQGDDELANDGETVDSDTGALQDDDADSDDYDPAFLNVNVFDLAIEKLIDTGATPGPYSPGDNVTFSVTVFNQGTVDATDVVVEDYIPSDMSFVSSPDFSLVGAQYTSTIASLAAGGMQTLSITLMIDNTFMGTSIVNNAEITSALNALGLTDQDDDLADIDGSSDDTNELDTNNDTDDEAPGTPGTVDNPLDVDDYDPEEVPVVQLFDLALEKTTSSSTPGPYTQGSVVTFTIEVTNQGTQDAYNVEIDDYYPECLVLTDSDWTVSSSGVASLNNDIDFIGIGETESVDITFTVSPTCMGPDIINYAEITAADNDDDPTNPFPIDADSTPGDNQGDDELADDGEIVDSDTGALQDDDTDSDDYDPELININVFDLAIEKLIDTGATPGPYSPGDNVTFSVTVFNQGTVDATDVVVEDYIPSDMSFVSSPDFSLVGAQYTSTIASLAAGGMQTLGITLMIDNTFMGTSIVNNAEITSAMNALGLTDQDDDLADIDGSSDDTTEIDTNNDTDDEAPGTPGTADNPLDVDDYDPEEVPVVQIFDLALEKVIRSSTPGPYSPGDNVTFTIEVSNQGTLNAYNVEIDDYFPDCLILTDPDWTVNSTGVASLNNDIEFIGIGEMVSVDITFMIDASCMGTMVINYAEITQADNDDDPTNGFPTDADSTPGDNQGDDELADDGEIVDSDTGALQDDDADSDDYDPAFLDLQQVFDLALDKTFNTFVDTDMDGFISQGESVTFDVTVYNQGTLDATGVEVTDYLPTGMNFVSSPDFVLTGGSYVATVGNLAAGASQTLEITLSVDDMFMGMYLFNNAEIIAGSNALDLVDQDDDLADIDGLSDDTSEVPTDNDIDDEIAGTPGVADNPEDIDDYDVEMIMVGQVFDLALNKVYSDYSDTNGDGVLSPGDDVEFLVTVYNQGTLDAYNIQVTDYIPTGLALNDANWNTLSNPNEAQLNSVIPFLGAQMNTTLTINFTIDLYWRGDAIVNWAEISAADDDTDPTNEYPEDIDSEPNSDIEDDNFGGDNEIFNADNDEDDHDPAEINPIVELDLALAKLDQSEDPVSNYGEERTFDIEVTNQGTIVATEFTVVDYIPCGFQFVPTPGVNPGWTYDSTTRIAEFLYDETILFPDETAVLNITLVVIECDEDVNYNWTNYAEISDFDDDFDDFNPDLNDIDSDPDATNFDDAGGEPWTLTDDYIDGDGTGPLGTGAPENDEDDHDPEKVEIFDLALSKVISINTPGPYSYYDNITFDIEVTNQGNIGAQNISVADYIPVGYAFNASDNAGWSGTYPNVSYTIDNTIPAGGSEVISITLQIIQPDGGEKDWINYSEITSADNENGDDRTDWDIDSNPASNSLAENDVEPDDVEDNDIDSTDKGGEEDDHDPAGIEIFDLAVYMIDDTEILENYGDDVTFTIEVHNQGSITSDGFTLTDYVPSGYIFNAADNPGWVENVNGTISYEYPDAIVPGELVWLELVLEAVATKEEDGWINYIEISEDNSVDPNVTEDIDSNPDTTLDNDSGGLVDSNSDDVVTGIGIDAQGNSTGTYQDENPLTDEDDHDPETIIVYDLALYKSLITEEEYAYGDLLEFEVCVVNQGSEPMYNVELSDYIPIGYSYDGSENLDWVSDGSGTVTQVISGPIERCDTLCRSLFLTLERTDGGYSDWVNYGEITEMQNEDLEVVDDVDSTPGSNGVDELAVQPNDLLDDDTASIDEGGEEDDHDPAGPEIFDLAQIKFDMSGGPYKYGDVVSFDIDVYNQGNRDAYDVEVVDYVPDGFTFDPALNPGWTYDGINVAYRIPGPIAPGAKESLSINLVLRHSTEQDAWLNFTEISLADDDDDPNNTPPYDVDSDPDNDVTNDGPYTDMELNGGPDDPSNPDEDDHDPDLVEVFDLALIKVSKFMGVDSIGPFVPGDIVDFHISVYNQGNVSALNYEITDYLNNGFAFDPALNPDWMLNGNLLHTTIDGPLDPEQSIELILKLEVQIADDATAGDWYNEAEVSYSEDPSGNNTEDGTLVDSDSTPDVDPDNDNDLVDGPDQDPIFNGDDNDNVIDEHVDDPFNEGDDDEDDNDAAEILITSELGDTVWKDVDGNGIQDPGEAGVEGVKVIITRCDGEPMDPWVTDTVYTDASGMYLFDKLLPSIINGGYMVEFDISEIPEGCAFTLQDQGADDGADSDVNLGGLTECVFLDPGQNDYTIDAGLLILASLGDYVWHDLDGDGQQNSGEPGIEGVNVQLYNANGILLGIALTDENGYYLFDNLYPGDYYVQFVAPDGMELTFPNTGSNVGNDSDVDGSNGPGTTQLTTLSSGENDLTWDAGYYFCIPLGQLVWYDVNGNDVHDSEENGINGILVEVYRDNEGTFELWDTQYTGHEPGSASNDGYWKMCVQPGNYYVKYVTPPFGLVLVSDNIGSDDTIDSDVTLSNGPATTDAFTVLSGEMKCDIGAGYEPMATLGDRVWYDANGNGMADVGEDGIKDVQVTVYTDEGMVVDETLTDVNGEYHVDLLQERGYFLEFSPPSGYVPTIANNAAENMDSDVDHTYGLNTTTVYYMRSGEHTPNIDAGFMVSTILSNLWLGVSADRIDNQNQIDWTIVNDIEVDYYTLQVRVDGEFKDLGEKISEKVSDQYTYHMIDNNATTAGTYFYRIAATKSNGSVSYSEIVSVEVEANEIDNDVRVYPNPASEAITVVISNEVPNTKALLSIRDINGRAIFSNLLLDSNLGIGEYYFPINVDEIPGGVYSVEVTLDNITTSKKIVVID